MIFIEVVFDVATETRDDVVELVAPNNGGVPPRRRLRYLPLRQRP
jgi:hypothetical protein